MSNLTYFFEFAQILGFSFLFGLAFEDYYFKSGVDRPGGVRTFPLLALAGALLYRIDPVHYLPLCVGLLMLGTWLAVYYWKHMSHAHSPKGYSTASLMIPICNLLAFLLGPAVLVGPAWVPIAATVAGILFLTERKPLHELASKIEIEEIATAGKFAIILGLILPIMPNVPVTSLTSITPYQLWLAVVAVSSISYLGYLLQKYVAPKGSDLLISAFGGMYSSTVTTVVLAKRARTNPHSVCVAQAGIILATSVMYLRILAIVLLFNFALGMALAPVLLALFVVSAICAGILARISLGRVENLNDGIGLKINPLEIPAAIIFAILFVFISMLTHWLNTQYGPEGILTLASIVGFSDIDPFILSLVQDPVGVITLPNACLALMIAVASNNLMKGIYAIFFMGIKNSVLPFSILLGLGILGLGILNFL